MTSAALATRTSAFQVAPVVTASAPAPSAPSGDAVAIDRLLATGRRLDERWKSYFPFGDWMLGATFTGMTLLAGTLATEAVVQSRPEGFVYGALVFLTGAATMIPVVAKYSKGALRNRADLNSVDLRGPATSAMERQIVAECARRCARMSNVFDYSPGLAARRACTPLKLADDSDAALKLAFIALFEDGSLAPRQRPLDNVEQLVFALARCAEADKPALARFVTKVVEAAGIPAADTVDGYRHAQLRAAIEGKPFSFLGLQETTPPVTLDDDQIRDRDVALAEARLSLAQQRAKAPNVPAWGKGTCYSATVAVGIAAQLEREGLRVSLMNTAKGAGKPVSIMVYEREKAPAAA